MPRDPDNGFKPAPGVIEQLILAGGPWVRVGNHLYSGYEIPPFYDSLVVKLIVWANARNMAIMRMRRALDEFQIQGLKTTIPFHQRVMRDEDFIKGDINTHFVKKFEEKHAAIQSCS